MPILNSRGLEQLGISQSVSLLVNSTQSLGQITPLGVFLTCKVLLTRYCRSAPPVRVNRRPMPSLLREILLGDLVPFGNPADWSNFLVMSVLFYFIYQVVIFGGLCLHNQRGFTIGKPKMKIMKILFCKGQVNNVLLLNRFARSDDQISILVNIITKNFLS